MVIDETIKEKREQIIAIAAKYGANNVRIFGSVARGEADEKSDIDLLIDYCSEHRSPWFPLRLIRELAYRKESKAMSQAKTVNNPRGHSREFQTIITEKSRNFIGREFVFTAINDFLQQYDRGYFTLIGEPGIGKSAIVAHYVRKNLEIVYYNVEITQKNDAEEFLSTINHQLIEIAHNQGIPGKTFSNRNPKDSGFLSLLLQKISDLLSPEQRLIITIDGCDRIDLRQQPRGKNIFYLPRYLPEKVYFILPRRPFLSDKSGLLIETPAQYLDLSVHREQNQADIQEYIKNYLNYYQIINEQLLTKISKNETNFMYVKEILASQNLPNDTLPQNLQDYYQNHWEKMNLGINQPQSMGLQVLNILVQQEQSISIAAIAEILDEDEYDIQVILDKWREFLYLETISGQIHYRFYHPSFRNWLRQQLEY